VGTADRKQRQRAQYRDVVARGEGGAVKRTRKGAVVSQARQTKSLFASQDRKPRLLFKMVNLVLRQALSCSALERPTEVQRIVRR
jgi:hypothetical protein